MTTYLDNAATSWPKPPAVHRAMVRFLEREAANPGRASYHMAVVTEKHIDDARVRIARLVRTADPARVVFTLNCTDALNMAIKGVLRPGDHVITTTLEHNSVSRPLQAMADKGVINLTRIAMSGGGFVDPDAIARAFTPATRLVVCTHCSNVIGTIQPIAEIGRLAREHDALLLVDAAQSAGIVPIDVEAMSIDLLAVAGHKSLLGPAGTGALVVGPRCDLRPWREGGTGGDSAHPTQPAELPYLLEGGTPNTVGIVGLAAGIDEVLRHDPAAVLAHERKLAARLTDGLREDGRFRVLGPDDFSRRVGVVSFTCDVESPHALAAALDESFDIAVRAGLHCAPYLHRELGSFPDGAIRVSPGPFNTLADIDHLLDALRKIIL